MTRFTYLNHFPLPRSYNPRRFPYICYRRFRYFFNNEDPLGNVATSSKYCFFPVGPLCFAKSSLSEVSVVTKVSF